MSSTFFFLIFWLTTSSCMFQSSIYPLKCFYFHFTQRTKIFELSNITCCPESTKLYFGFETRCLSDIGPCENISSKRTCFLPLGAYFWSTSFKKTNFTIFKEYASLRMSSRCFAWLKLENRHLKKCSALVFPLIAID